MNQPFFEALNKLTESLETPATKWIRSLPLYVCPTCQKETIFASGCSEHDEEVSV
jgi:hypothetical protein